MLSYPLSTFVAPLRGLPLKRPHPMHVAISLQDARGGTWPPLASDLFGLRYPWIETSSGIMRIATMFAILIIGLIAGPAVSL